MDFVHRRMEIISILSAKRHITTRELAWEFGVTRRTILHDIVALSFDYPIYTKPGEGGGIFITENYKPYSNTLTPTELETLCRLYRKSEGKDNEILFRIIHKYGADKLKNLRHILFSKRGVKTTAFRRYGLSRLLHKSEL